MAYLLPTRRARNGGRLSALLGFLPVPTTAAAMPHSLIAARSAATFRPLTGYGLTLGAVLPSINVRSTASRSIPVVTAARAISARTAAWQSRQLRRGRRSGGMGDDSTDIDWATGLPCDDPRANCQSVTTAPNAPPAPPQASQPITQAYKNALTQAIPSSNPLDYVSPQAAIAAGLDPATVNAAWAQGLSRFPTQQAAVNAGVNPGAVNSLWQQSRAYPAAVSAGSGSVTSWLAQNWPIPVALVGGFALMRSLRGR